MAARHAAGVTALLVSAGFDGDVYFTEPLSRHTTYRIGGPAKYFVRVNSVGALAQLVDACKQEGMPWTLLGRGSNLLVADEGYPGVVITLGRDFRILQFDAEYNVFSAGAGVMLSAVVQEAFAKARGGFEFAVGTPGTLGGALRMNAGSRDEWIGGRVRSVTTFSPDGTLQRRMPDEIEWGYRYTSFAADEIIVECELTVDEADPFAVRDRMEENLARRKKSQPLNDPSCGSVFRNPPGASAGALIDALGLKGATVGGARVSDVHANFIVNTGSASAHDVRALISLIQEKVYEAHGIELQTEVRFLGFDRE